MDSKIGLSAILFVLAALLVGGIVGYVLGSGSGGEFPDAPDRTPEGSPEDGSRARRPAGTGRPVEEPRGEGRVALPPLPPPGDGTITGIVRTIGGRPVEGALVRASLRLKTKSTPRFRGGVPADREPPASRSGSTRRPGSRSGW